MKRNSEHIEDLLTNVDFRNWVNHPTPELDAFWKQWLAENQDKKYLVEQARSIQKSIGFHEYKASVSSKSNILNSIRQKTQAKKTITFALHFAYRIAAILIIGLGVGYFLQSQKSGESLLSGMTVKSNQAGEQSRIMLPDGSLVELNSSSNLTYATSFDGEIREVNLKGEAFFDVATNKSRPFKVVSNALEIEVLGTEFNVISQDSVFEVALVEGSVQLTSATGEQALLRPNEKASYDFDTNTFVISTFEVNKVLGWKNGYLVFDSASYHDVVRKLHNWYGVQISADIPSKLDDWTYTATFKNETIENVLLSMRTLRHFEYSFNKDTLIISFE